MTRPARRAMAPVVPIIGLAMYAATVPSGASPGTGASSTILARGTTADEIKVHAKGDSDFVFAEVTLQPGGHTGWHHHPGPLLVAVRSGTLTRYDVDCRPHTHHAGQSFIELDGDRNVHIGTNQGEEPVVLLVTYIVPTADALRHDASAPACAVDADLPT